VNLSEIKDAKLRDRILAADREQNGDPLARLSAAQRQRNAVGESATGNADEKESPRILVVSIIRFGSKELDSDNLAFGCKWLRDAIADSLGIDDGDKRIKWQYGQILTAGPTGSMVTIQAAY